MKRLDVFIKELMLSRLESTNVFDRVGTNYVKSQDLEKLIIFINEAITCACTEYPFYKKEALIKTTLPITKYYLRKEFSVSSNSTEEIKYILDTVETPFYEYVIKPLYIFNTAGDKLAMNDMDDNTSWFLIEHDCMQFTLRGIGDYFSIIYQANHLPLVSTNLSSQYINLPPYMESVLMDHVAYLVYKNLSGQVNEIRSNIHYAQYKNRLIELNNTGVFPNMNYDSNVFIYNRDIVNAGR